MSATFYFLYSDSIDTYYVGHCTEPMEERLRKHNSNHKGFPGRTSDWRVTYFERYLTKEQAYAREREVKKMQKS